MSRMHLDRHIVIDREDPPPTDSVRDGSIPSRTDRAAEFTAFYREHYERIGSYLFRRTGHRQETEDLLSEAFLAAFRGFERFEDRGVPIVCWLYGIATRVLHRSRRLRSRLESIDPTEVVESSEPDRNPAIAMDRAAMVRRRLDRLPRRFRDVMALFYLEELSVEQIALSLDVAVGTVKSRLSRGREQLRRALEVDRDVR